MVVVLDHVVGVRVVVVVVWVGFVDDCGEFVDVCYCGGCG